MLKSCSLCGRIHDGKFICKPKQEQIKARQSKYKGTDKDKFRWTKAWQDKREEIKERDLCLCQICIRRLYNTVNQYTYNNLSVHHAIPLEIDYDKRLDNDNLITTCDYHHEKMENGEISIEEALNIIKEQESKLL